MNRLYVGFAKEVEVPRGGFLLIEDELRDIPRSRIFDPLKHSLNPLKDISYRQAREIADIVYTVYPQGENTLTVRNGKRELLAELLKTEKWNGKRPDRFDKIKGDEEVRKTVQDLLMSPVLRRVLCNPTNFSFRPNSMIQARIKRAELGDFDALVLGLLLMSHYKGQVIVPDWGFYGRDAHVRLIREKRLIAGVNHLYELPTKLRHSALLIEDKVASGAVIADAELIAQFAGHVRGTTGFTDFVQSATA